MPGRPSPQTDVNVDATQRTPAPSDRPAGADAFSRLAVSRRAPRTIRLHLLRSLRRVLVLVAADASTLILLREVVRGLRDAAWLGDPLAAAMAQLVPGGPVRDLQMLPAILLGLLVTGNYGAGDRRRDEGSLVAGVALGLALPFWNLLWSRPEPLLVPGFILSLLVGAGAIIAERKLVDRMTRRWRGEGAGQHRALIVGSPVELTRARAHPAIQRARSFRILATVEPQRIAAEQPTAWVSRLYATLEHKQIDTILLASYLEDEVLAALLDAAAVAGCQVYSVSRTVEMYGVTPRIEWRHGAPLVALSRPSLRGQQLLLKRAMDLVGAAAGLTVLAPVFALLALAVRLGSPGPALFRQERVGLGGKTFRIYKFRSMRADAERGVEDLRDRSVYADPRLFKVADDPRVTSVGRWLRRTSLDELPQLINVLLGEMSLVGPRPPLPSEVQLYEAHHYARFDVKPGMTGPWQVAGRNMVTDFEQVVRLETAYIRTWSLWKDIAILLRTVPVVVGMKGAH